MNILKQWITKRNKKHFDDGYNFAAGLLLRNSDSKLVLNSLYEELTVQAEYSLDKNDFDRGVLQAVSDFKKVK